MLWGLEEKETGETVTQRKGGETERKEGISTGDQRRRHGESLVSDRSTSPERPGNLAPDTPPGAQPNPSHSPWVLGEGPAGEHGSQPHSQAGCRRKGMGSH